MRCPICKAVLTSENKEFRPFCSARCKTIDLGNWLTESYRVPLEESNDQLDEEEATHALPRKPIGDA